MINAATAYRRNRSDVAIAGPSARDLHMASLRHVTLLPADEQARLAQEYQRTQDPRLAARLVASNVRLVVRIATQLTRSWAELMELVAEGNVGLVEAISRFDASRGIPFPTYAAFWIRARILTWIQANRHVVHTGSRAGRKLFWRLERERRALEQEGLEPTHARLAERLGVTEADLDQLAPVLDYAATSLDAPLVEGGSPRSELTADPDRPDPEALATEAELRERTASVLAELRATLGPREAALWDERLTAEEPVRLEDIGRRFGVSKERARQLEVRLKKRIADYVRRVLGPETLAQALA